MMIRWDYQWLFLERIWGASRDFAKVALLTTVKHVKYSRKRANGLWVIRCHKIDDLFVTKSIIIDYNKLLVRKSWNRLYWVITKKWLFKWFIRQQTLMFLMTTHMIVHFPYFHQAPSFIGWWLKKKKTRCSDKNLSFRAPTNFAANAAEASGVSARTKQVWTGGF